MASFQEGVHFYFDESGRMVLTARYLLERGYCCKNGCRHCPYSDEKPITKEESSTIDSGNETSNPSNPLP